METTFKVILIAIMILSCLGAIGDKDRHKIMSLSGICIASILAMTIMVVWM